MFFLVGAFSLEQKNPTITVISFCQIIECMCSGTVRILEVEVPNYCAIPDFSILYPNYIAFN